MANAKGSKYKQFEKCSGCGAVFEYEDKDGHYYIENGQKIYFKPMVKHCARGLCRKDLERTRKEEKKTWRLKKVKK